MNIIAIGYYALWLVTTQSYIIAVGIGAGNPSSGEFCVILVGDHVQAPPGARYYINVDGREYPNSTRNEPWFQSMVRARAQHLIDQMTDDDLGGGEPKFKGNRAQARMNIQNMPFFEKECAGRPVS